MIGTAVLLGFSLSGFASEQVFDVPAGHFPGAWRMRWNVGGPMDISQADGLEFDFLSDDMERFGEFILRVRTCDDPQPIVFTGYSFRFQPYKRGRWHRVRLLKTYADGRICQSGSWADIKGMELVGQEGDGSGAMSVGIACKGRRP